jgi:hypothetical protein
MRNQKLSLLGQNKISVTARFKELKSHTTNNHIQLSSVANPMKMKLNGGEDCVNIILIYKT